jgi:chromosome partitioning protein
MAICKTKNGGTGMTKTIMVSNQKGGVGKTTTTLELGAIYARKGKRVLVIDLDGQVNLSMYVNAKYDDKNIPTIRDVLLEIKEILKHSEPEKDEDTDDGEEDIITKSIQTTSEGFDIIAGHRNLSNALAEFSDITDVFLLKELISCLEDYDYILIDSAPARSPLLNMGYVAANYCLILTEADKASQDGVRQVVTDIKLLKKSNMSDIVILGILLNKNEDLKNQEEAYEDLCAFGKTNDCMPFETIISKAAGATTAKNMYKSIHAYKDTRGIDKRGIQGILKDFDNLADEIEKRIKKIER